MKILSLLNSNKYIQYITVKDNKISKIILTEDVFQAKKFNDDFAIFTNQEYMSQIRNIVKKTDKTLIQIINLF